MPGYNFLYGVVWVGEHVQPVVYQVSLWVLGIYVYIAFQVALATA